MGPFLREGPIREKEKEHFQMGGMRNPHLSPLKLSKARREEHQMDRGRCVSSQQQEKGGNFHIHQEEAKLWTQSSCPLWPEISRLWQAWCHT